MHLNNPFDTLYDGSGQLKKCYQASECYDLTFNYSKQGKKKGAQSKIPGMSIGDIRQCFVQLRVLHDSLTCDTLLFNGYTAGAFALLYVQKCYTSKCRAPRRKKNKKHKKMIKIKIQY